MTDKPTDYRNRIKALEYVNSADLVAHPGNWRAHPAAQAEALKGVLAEVGIAGALLAYRSERQGGALVVIDGHLRKDAAPQKWPVLILDVDDAEADYILATHDPLAAMATADAGALDALLSSVQSGDAAVTAMLAELAEGAGLYAPPEDDNYSRKIEPPIYRPTGPKPAVKDLYDPSRTNALIEDIETQEGLTDEERGFLIAAAQRHTVIRFDRVAEYYAHSDAPTQRLMENSALVIIDFNRAIELGFVQMTEKIAELVRDEYGG